MNPMQSPNTGVGKKLCQSDRRWTMKKPSQATWKKLSEMAIHEQPIGFGEGKPKRKVGLKRAKEIADAIRRAGY